MAVCRGILGVSRKWLIFYVRTKFFEIIVVDLALSTSSKGALKSKIIYETASTASGTCSRPPLLTFKLKKRLDWFRIKPKTLLTFR